jgi:hypothetical protein
MKLEKVVRALVTDERGGTYSEFLIVIIPILAFGLGILQLSQLFATQMAVDHATVNAARSAGVVLADDPKFYGGEPANKEGTRRTAAVRLAALRSLAPYVLDGSIQAVDVSFPDGVPQQRGRAMTVEVKATFRCSVPLVARVVCQNGGTKALVSRQKFASQAAAYAFDSSGPGPLSAFP